MYVCVMLAVAAVCVCVCSSGQECFHYQLFMEKEEHIVLPTTQQLLGLSFLQSDVKLAKVRVLWWKY